jgi:hypothetical protein
MVLSGPENPVVLAGQNRIWIHHTTKWVLHRINKLMYMDDIKFYGFNEKHIQHLHRTDTFSKNINMHFAPHKSKTMCVSQGNFTLKDFRYDWTDWHTHTHTHTHTHIYIYIYIYAGLLLAYQTKHKGVKYNGHSCIHKEINTCTWVLT